MKNGEKRRVRSGGWAWAELESRWFESLVLFVGVRVCECEIVL